MTTKYECNRCHRQTTDHNMMMEITVRTKDRWGEQTIVRHYCSFCSLIMNNAISIVNNGTYSGSLNATDKIGNYRKELKDADPFFNKDLEMKE